MRMNNPSQILILNSRGLLAHSRTFWSTAPEERALAEINANLVLKFVAFRDTQHARIYIAHPWKRTKALHHKLRIANIIIQYLHTASASGFGLSLILSASASRSV